MSVASMSLRTIGSPTMMPAAEGMTHVIPNLVLRVGQTIRLDPAPEAGDRDLDISLENLNRIILELDPTFEPLHLDRRAGLSAGPVGGGDAVGTLFCLWSLLHTKKEATQHKQSQPLVGQRFDKKKPHSQLMKQTCSLGFCRAALIWRGIYCFNSCGDCILAAAVELPFRQVPRPAQTRGTAPFWRQDARALQGLLRGPLSTEFAAKDQKRLQNKRTGEGAVHTSESAAYCQIPHLELQTDVLVIIAMVFLQTSNHAGHQANEQQAEAAEIIQQQVLRISAHCKRIKLIRTSWNLQDRWEGLCNTRCLRLTVFMDGGRAQTKAKRDERENISHSPPCVSLYLSTEKRKLVFANAFLSVFFQATAIQTRTSTAC